VGDPDGNTFETKEDEMDERYQTRKRWISTVGDFSKDTVAKEQAEKFANKTTFNVMKSINPRPDFQCRYYDPQYMEALLADFTPNRLLSAKVVFPDLSTGKHVVPRMYKRKHPGISDEQLPAYDVMFKECKPELIQMISSPSFGYPLDLEGVPLEVISGVHSSEAMRRWVQEDKQRSPIRPCDLYFESEVWCPEAINAIGQVDNKLCEVSKAYTQVCC
jgi:hypothetical protein